MDIVKCRLTGVGPLLMHSDRLSDPLDPQAKKHKELTSLRTKTDDVHLAIALSEWRCGMYYDPKIGPYMPGENIQASFRNGAKINKLGTTFEKSCIVLEEQCPLEYIGPRGLSELEKHFDEYSFRKSVVVQRSRLWRVRPIFREWSLECTVQYVDSIINANEIKTAITNAGQVAGLGDWRPRFGRYSVEFI